MALFRKLFYKKPPDGLLDISGDRIYVFDRCLTTDVWEEKNYKGYVSGIISQLRDHYPDVSILAFNFREGESHSLIANCLSEHDVTIMDYPQHYEGCPLLSMEMINHFLRSSESWLSLGQQNVLLMHCELGGWPVLAFMLAALLIYRRHFSGEQKTLDMIYKQAPRELLYLMQPLNPIPSQLRYLHYVTRRNLNTQLPSLDKALILDCIIIRTIPNFDGKGGCRPIFRMYGQDPSIVSDLSPKKLFSTPKSSNVFRYYKQAECELVKIDINCHVQGDIVLECISLHDDREEMMFRTMFNTSFVNSNILILNRDEIDILWDAKDQFPKDFRVEVLFSEIEMDAAASIVPVDLSCFEKKDGLPVEAFSKVQEIINSAYWLNQKGDAAGNRLQQITESNLILEMLESPPETLATSKFIDETSLEKRQERQEPATLEYNAKGLTQSTSNQHIGSSSEAYRSNNQEDAFQLVETKESSTSATSSPRSPHEHKTAEHPSLHGQEYGEVSSLPEIKCQPHMTAVLTSTSPPSLLTKEQGIVIGQHLTPASMPPELFTPLNDKLDVPSPPLPTPPRDHYHNSVNLKDDTTTVSQPDTSLLPLQMPLSPCENDIIAKTEPALPTFPSGSLSPSGPITNIKHFEEKLVSTSGMSPSPPPLPHSVPVLEENSAYVCGTSQSPAPPTPPLKQTLTFSDGSSPPPPPLPPPAPTSSPCLLITTPGLNKNRSSLSGPSQPPPPPTSPLKERLVPEGGMPPPPPPPLPLFEQSVKENSSLTGAPCPPLPPSSQASKPTDLYAVPPKAPPPSLVSFLKDNSSLPKNVPSVPPPPVPFHKVNNLPPSPSPSPPVAPPPNKNY